MNRRWRIALTVLGVPVLLALAVGTAWAVDMQSFGGEVVRNTTLARTPVGGLDAAELEAVVARIDQGVRQSTIVVETPAGSFEMAAGEISLSVDRPATIAAALETGRTGNLAERAARWLGSFAGDRRAPVEVNVDRALLTEVVAARDPARTAQPVEPSVAVRNGRVVAVAGRDGEGTEPQAVLEGIAAAATRGEHPLVVRVSPGPVAPRFTPADARRVAERANLLTRQPLEVRAGEAAATVSTEMLRSWIAARPAAGGLVLGTDDAQVIEDLAELLPEAGEEPVDARFEVRGDQVVIVRGRRGTACCADTTPATVLSALVDRPTDPVALPLRQVDPDLTSDRASQLGVDEPVATFTTRYQPGQARVTNIHRIADLVRGQLLEPGESFSVNGFVGRRTRDKGFVPAGVIYDGEFTEDVGGGISQFATTLFNAAFFAGLELDEYQSHSIYISRYPYGREATLSYPEPDLVFTNNTPYGVLIWPTYTDDSITVTLWSTKHVEVTQSGQSTQPAGNCTRVVTERTRRYMTDERIVVDRVFARYRPEEGVNC